MTARVTGRLAAALALGLAGCPAPQPCTVAGQVQWKGRPAEGVYVVLHAAPVPDGGRSPASARTGKDGTYTLTVAEPGEYAVTVFWPKVTVEAGEVVEGDDRLRGSLRDPARPVSLVAIRAGENALPPIHLNP